MYSTQTITDGGTTRTSRSAVSTGTQRSGSGSSKGGNSELCYDVETSADRMKTSELSSVESLVVLSD
jgi:hypothetical protein